MTLDLGGTVFWVAPSGEETYSVVVPAFGSASDFEVIRLDASLDAGVLAESQSNVQTVTLEQDYVYWGIGDADGGALARVARTGGTPEVVARTDLPVGAVGSCCGKVFFATFSPVLPSQEALYKFEVETGRVDKLVTDVHLVLQIVPLQEGVYWTEQYRRVARIEPLP